MSWAKIKEKQAIGGQGMGKAFQLSKALAAMGYTSWNRLEPGDYMIDIFCRHYGSQQNNMYMRK